MGLTQFFSSVMSTKQNNKELHSVSSSISSAMTTNATATIAVEASLQPESNSGTSGVVSLLSNAPKSYSP